MATYTSRQADSWFNMGALLNTGTIFAINCPDGDPISPEPGKNCILNPLRKIFNWSARQNKKPVDPNTDQSTTPAVDPNSQP